jgi:hypothetical protein
MGHYLTKLLHFVPIRILTTALTSRAFKRIIVRKFIIRVHGIAPAMTIWTFTLVFHSGDMILVLSLFPLIKRVEKSHFIHLIFFLLSMEKKWNYYACIIFCLEGSNWNISFHLSNFNTFLL